MKSLRRFLIRMILFLAAVAAVVVLLFVPLERVFLHNVPLNSMILGAAFIGIIYIVRQVLQLEPELAWIESHRTARPALSRPAPRLLGPMAAIVAERPDKAPLISTMTMRTLLDSISARLDEARDISHYLIGLMIFLGLLGTFWGLLETVNSVGSVIRNLEIGSRDATAVFNSLKTGLEQPLSGMGTSFSSSLFGLASSLVLGFLDLQAAQAQNVFYQTLEEWLSRITRLSGGTALGEGEASVPAYIEALLEKTADSLDGLQRVVGAGEESRSAANAQIGALNDRLANLADIMRTEQTVLSKMMDGQLDVRPELARLAKAAEGFEGLQRVMTVGDEGRNSVSAQLGTLNDRFAALAELMRREQPLLSKLVEGQVEVRNTGAAQLAALNERMANLADLMRLEQGSVAKLVESQLDARSSGNAQLNALNDRLASLGEHMRNEQAVLGRLADAQLEGRGSGAAQLATLNDRLAGLAELMKSEQAILVRLAEGQNEGRNAGTAQIGRLDDRLANLGEFMQAEQDALGRLVDTQLELRNAGNIQLSMLDSRLGDLADAARMQQGVLGQLVEAQLEVKNASNAQLAVLDDRLANMADLMRAQQTVLSRLIDGQLEVRTAGHAQLSSLDDRLADLAVVMRDEHTVLAKLAESQSNGRSTGTAQVATLNDRVANMADLMRTEQAVLAKLVEGQLELRPVLARLADAAGRSAFDESTRAHIRNLDVYMSRVVEEMTAGRQRTVEELRAEIRLLARTIASMAEEPGS
jgi:hypothetical protein